MQVGSAGQLLRGVLVSESVLVSETSDNVLSWASSHRHLFLQQAASESQCLMSVRFKGRASKGLKGLLRQTSN